MSWSRADGAAPATSTRSFAECLTAFHAWHEDPNGAARAFGAEGGKVVGIASPHVPRELIAAAGLFPAVLASDSREPTEMGDRYMEPIFDGPVRSLFDRTIRGRFDFADLLIMPRCGEGYLQLYYFLSEVRRWEPRTANLNLYLFDLLHTPNWTTGRYVRGRMDDLRARLELLAERTIADDDIALELRSTNAQARLLREVNALRRAIPARLSGVDALRIFASSGWTPQSAHMDLCRALLAASPDAAPLHGVRVMVKGSPHDTTQFYQLVENLGAVIVADDHLSGERLHTVLADEDAAPVQALAQKYHLRMPSIRSYPQAEQDRIFLDMVEAASVQAVIFFHEENDDTLGWDYPDQKRALDRRGIPSIYLKKQSWRCPEVKAQQEAVRDLIARARGTAAA